MLDPEKVDTLWQVNDDVLDIAQRACSGSCRTFGFLDLWCSRDDFKQEILDADDPQEELVDYVTRTETTCTGEEVQLRGICSNARRDQDGRVAFCQALTMTYTLDETDPEGVIEDFRDLAQDFQSNVTWTFVYFDTNAVDDAIGQSTQTGIGNFAGAFALLFSFLSLTQVRTKWLDSRAFLAALAILTIALSTVSAYGLLFAAGLPMTSLQALLPFILAGIGTCAALSLRWQI